MSISVLNYIFVYVYIFFCDYLNFWALLIFFPRKNTLYLIFQVWNQNIHQLRLMTKVHNHSVPIWVYLLQSSIQADWVQMPFIPVFSLSTTKTEQALKQAPQQTFFSNFWKNLDSGLDQKRKREDLEDKESSMYSWTSKVPSCSVKADLER